jgi:hypothetical protein
MICEKPRGFSANVWDLIGKWWREREGSAGGGFLTRQFWHWIKERSRRGTELVWEGEGGSAALWFISIWAREGDTRWCTAQRRLRCPEEEDGGRRVGHGPEWPGGPNASWAVAERKQWRKWAGPQGWLGQNGKSALDLIFQILFQGFELKIKGFKYFQIKFELRSN